MNSILVVLAVLMLAAGVASGIAALTTGWIFPGPARARVVRPRLWGYGTLVGMAGFGTFMFLGPIRGSDFRYAPFAVVGLAVVFAGLAMQWLAQRPGKDALTRS